MMMLKKFKIIDVLDWQPQKEIDPLAIKELSIDAKHSYPFYGQATINSGIISFLTLTNKVLNNPLGKPTILIHSNNQNIVYLETPFYLKDGHGATSVLQADELNEKNALYLIACIKKVITQKFEYNEKATKIGLKNTYIELPVTSLGDVDFKYMESFVRKLEDTKINKLSSYLTSKNLSTSKLDETEEVALSLFQNNRVRYEKFKLGVGENRLFDISSSKKKFNANTVKFNGKYPYVARSSTNNGIRGYISQEECYLNEGNTISFGQDTATIFYQEEPYFTGDKIKVMKYRDVELNPEIACYLITVMRKAFKYFAWGQTSFNENVLKNIEISLPVKKDGSIDYKHMISLIRSQEKKAMKSVHKWKSSEYPN